jgi:hypothetical protein
MQSGFHFPVQNWCADIYAALKRQPIAQVGNCVTMFSLLRSCGFPFVAGVTRLGEWAELN